MKYNTFCCVLVPRRRETWLEYLWELTDCLESSGDFSLALHDALIIRDALQLPLVLCKLDFHYMDFTPLMKGFIRQADGLKSATVLLSSDIKREEGALQFLCSSTLQTLPRVIVMGSNKHWFSQFPLKVHHGLLL